MARFPHQVRASGHRQPAMSGLPSLAGASCSSPTDAAKSTAVIAGLERPSFGLASGLGSAASLQVDLGYADAVTAQRPELKLTA
jgi:hypothetical protein